LKEKKYKEHNGPVPAEDLAPSGDEKRKSWKKQTGLQKAKSRQEKELARRSLSLVTGFPWPILEHISLLD
jgi:hypothetical protein